MFEEVSCTWTNLSLYNVGLWYLSTHRQHLGHLGQTKNTKSLSVSMFNVADPASPGVTTTYNCVF